MNGVISCIFFKVHWRRTAEDFNRNIHISTDDKIVLEEDNNKMVDLGKRKFEIHKVRTFCKHRFWCWLFCDRYITNLRCAYTVLVIYSASKYHWIALDFDAQFCDEYCITVDICVCRLITHLTLRRTNWLSDACPNKMLAPTHVQFNLLATAKMKTREKMGKWSFSVS